MFVQHIAGLSGLAAAVLFIFGLKRMSSPVTALSGIVVAGLGMVVAVAVSFLAVFDVAETVRPHLGVNLILAVAAIALGGGWAWLRGRKVEMTAMPQMVALYNGMGGGAAAAVAAVEISARGTPSALILAVTAAGALIGSFCIKSSAVIRFVIFFKMLTSVSCTVVVSMRPFSIRTSSTGTIISCGLEPPWT